MRKLIPLILCLYSSWLYSQDLINIALINDHPPQSALEKTFQQTTKNEILQLLQYKYEIQFTNHFVKDNSDDIEGFFKDIYTKSDIIVGLGSLTTDEMIRLKAYPKPTIGSIIIDSKLQGLSKKIDNGSGIQNFSYIESPFGIKRDLESLYEIYPYEHLVVLYEKDAVGGQEFTQQLFGNYLENPDIKVSTAKYESNYLEQIKKLGDNKIAVYCLPYLGPDSSKLINVFKNLNQNKIPSTGLFGEAYIQAGALMGYQTSDNLQKIPRRIALNIMKALEGEPLSQLPVEMQTFGENRLINMETARQIGIYPNFDIMAKSTLLNLENIKTDNRLSLSQAVAQALQNNLDLKISAADVGISQKEIEIAKSDLLPQLDISTSISGQDELSTLVNQGAQGRINWLGSAEFSQVIYAEPLLANVAIQEMLKLSEEKELLQDQLDVVIDICNAYINILFSKSNLNIQQENVAKTKENYDISKTKEAIGYVGASDINRWESELANANIQLNNAYATLRQSKFQLNQLLNRPVNEPVEIDNLTLSESMIMVTDTRTDFIDDYGKLDLFSDFLVEYAKAHLPELAQVDIGIAVQERLKLSRERALYLPTVALSGSANRVFAKFDVPDNLPKVDNATTWNIGIGISYPIFQGNNRRRLVEQSKLEIMQLQHTRANVGNQLELRIRSNLENVGASYSQVQLSNTSAEASQKNYDIVKDAYSAGQANITALIDAQNSALQTELNAINATYTFILDFLTLERSIGYYNFLATPTDRDQFFQEALQTVSQN